MKTTRPPKEIHGASKQGEKAKAHASWPNGKKTQTSTAKSQPKSPGK